MAKELTKTEKAGAIITYDYGADAAAGYENQTIKDTSIPFVVLLQGLSPQVTKETVEGAKPGLWMNTVTEQLWGREGFLFVPAITQNKVGIWTSRDDGGGFHGHMDIDDPVFLRAVKDNEANRGKTGPDGKEIRFGKYRDNEGHQLVDTFYVYGVLCTEEGEPDSAACIAFSSTKITPYKRWQTRLQQVRIRNERGMQRPPLYAHLTRISSFLDQNAKKQEYYVPKIASADPRGLKESLLDPTDERFLAAKAVYELVNSGAAKVDFSQQGGEEPEADSGQPNAFG